jgi:hypothetical protein
MSGLHTSCSANRTPPHLHVWSSLKNHACAHAVVFRIFVTPVPLRRGDCVYKIGQQYAVDISWYCDYKLWGQYSDLLRTVKSAEQMQVGARFSTPVQTGPGTHPASNTMPGLFTGGKAAEAWRWPPTPSSFEVKERIELCFYSPFWVFTACSRVNLYL